MLQTAGSDLAMDFFNFPFSLLDTVDFEWNRKLKRRTKLLYLLHSDYAMFRVPEALEAIEIAKQLPDEFDSVDVLMVISKMEVENGQG